MPKILRRAQYFKRLNKRASEAKLLDPRLVKLLPDLTGSAWTINLVELPEPEGEPEIHIHFRIKPTAHQEWRSWCYRILARGGALGIAIRMELFLDSGKPVEDWVISFKYVLDKKENWMERQFEAVQQFSDILKAAR